MSGPLHGPALGSISITAATLGRDRADGRQRLFERIAEVEDLSHVGRLLIDSCEQPTPTGELCHLLQQDPALVARMLRRVNSDYYKLRRSCDSLVAAIELLGADRVRTLAFTVLISRRFTEPDFVEDSDLGRIWHHLVAVATVADMISRTCGRANPQMAFLGGLLHDLGLAFLARHFGRHFRAVLREVVCGDRSTIEVEQEVYGFDHTQVGMHVARRWGFPQALVDVMADHHRPELCGGEDADLVAVVATANYLCSRGGWTSLGIHNVAPPTDTTSARLGLDGVTLSILWENLPDTLRRAGILARG